MHPPSLADNDDLIFCLQFDGNISISSSISSSMSFTASIDPLHIPVHMNYRPDNYFPQLRLPPVRRVIRRGNKVLQARSLPKLSFSIAMLHTMVDMFHTRVLRH